MAENFILITFMLLMVVLFAITRFFFRVILPAIRHRRVFSLICGNFLIFLSLLSVLLLTGEIYYRFVFDSTDSFGLCLTTERWFDRHYHKNATGFRDSIEYQPEPSSEVPRISFVGDSFTAGHGIANVEERFANIIRRKQPNWEIHVLADCGWDTGMEVDLVDFIPRSGYDTNYVVLVYCLNDVADIVPEWQELSKQLYEAPKPGLFVRYSFLLNTIHGRLRASMNSQLADYYHFVRNGYKGDLWQEQQLRLTKFRSEVETQKWNLLVVTFPFVHNLGENYPWRKEHQQFSDFWESLSVPHLDLLSVMEENAELQLAVGRHDAHPNERAHALAAKFILRFLRENIRQ